jgi:hypothetical protein
LLHLQPPLLVIVVEHVVIVRNTVFALRLASMAIPEVEDLWKVTLGVTITMAPDQLEGTAGTATVEVDPRIMEGEGNETITTVATPIEMIDSLIMIEADRQAIAGAETGIEVDATANREIGQRIAPGKDQGTAGAAVVMAHLAEAWITNLRAALLVTAVAVVIAQAT